MAVHLSAIRKLLLPVYELEENEGIKFSRKNIPEKYVYLMDYIKAAKLPVRKVGDMAKFFEEDKFYQGELSDYGSFTKFDGWSKDHFGATKTSLSKVAPGKVALYVNEETYGFKTAKQEFNQFCRNELKKHIDAYEKSRKKDKK